MSKIWSAMIMLSIGVSFFIGDNGKVLPIITNSCASSIESILVITGTMCFWSGVFNILQHTKIINIISSFLKPIISLLFGNNLTNQELDKIALNMTSNLIGIGNAATVYGIKAIEEMQRNNKNKDSANENIALFVLINTASIQLIPTNIISLRMAYGSQDPNWVILPNLIASLVSLIIGIIVVKIIYRMKRKC
ncbi:MAG: hypothetical protein IKV94_06140 [Clostridia bacterium]|nr:hypothetical protein [Clostridia bacterium]